MHGLSCFKVRDMYIGYFDEFGHNGAYISRNDRKFKTHPAFGIGGFIIPADNARGNSFQNGKCYS